MPDISMCGLACAKSKTCYRHSDSGTTPAERQSWFGFPCAAGLGGPDCVFYIGTTPDRAESKPDLVPRRPRFYGSVIEDDEASHSPHDA